MNAKFLCSVLALAAVTTSASAVVTIDEFNGAGLDTNLWTLSDAAGNYGPGGGFGMVAGQAKFQQIKGENYGNIRTSLGNIGAGDTVRADAKMRLEQYGAGRWTQGVAIYFNNNNWVQLREAYSGGEAGWVRQEVINGTLGGASSAGGGDMRYYHVIAGVELTPTQIRFYGSPVGVDKSGVTSGNIDTNVSLLSDLTLPRPASFTGQGYAIIGKGFGGAFGLNNLYLNNNGGSFLDPADTYIDFARINAVPEPVGMGLLAIGSAWLMRRRSE